MKIKSFNNIYLKLNLLLLEAKEVEHHRVHQFHVVLVIAQAVPVGLVLQLYYSLQLFDPLLVLDHLLDELVGDLRVLGQITNQ